MRRMGTAQGRWSVWLGSWLVAALGAGLGSCLGASQCWAQQTAEPMGTVPTRDARVTGGLEVQADVPSATSRDLVPGTAVTVTPAEQPVLVEPGG